LTRQSASPRGLDQNGLPCGLADRLRLMQSLLATCKVLCRLPGTLDYPPAFIFATNDDQVPLRHSSRIPAEP
jgi:hypothetical protein